MSEEISIQTVQQYVDEILEEFRSGTLCSVVLTRETGKVVANKYLFTFKDGKVVIDFFHEHIVKYEIQNRCLITRDPSIQEEYFDLLRIFYEAHRFPGTRTYDLKVTLKKTQRLTQLLRNYVPDSPLLRNQT